MGGACAKAYGWSPKKAAKQHKVAVRFDFAEEVLRRRIEESYVVWHCQPNTPYGYADREC
jgi:hypothetical protein